MHRLVHGRTFVIKSEYTLVHKNLSERPLEAGYVVLVYFKKSANTFLTFAKPRKPYDGPQSRANFWKKSTRQAEGVPADL
jgi:hypothetical protein